MKKQLLIVAALLISSAAFTQLTNGLISQFYFTGGTLQNSVITSSLTVNVDGEAYTYGPDRDGNANSAIEFDGNTGFKQKLSIEQANLEFNLTNDFSISFWFKTNDINAADLQVLFSSRQDFTPGEKGGVDCYINGNGEFEVVYRRASSGAPIDGLNTSKTKAINAGTWYHVTIVRSGSDVSHFINASVESTETITDFPTTNFPIVNYWNIGAFFNTQNGQIYRELDGSMDDIRLYNRALTLQEVIDLYQETPPSLSLTEVGNSSVQIYPNPVQDALKISSNATIKEVIITSTDGKVVHTGSNTNTLDVSALKEGTYFIKCVLENKQVVTKKFIRN